MSTRGSHDRAEVVDMRDGASPRYRIAIGIPSLGSISAFVAARLVQLRIPMNTSARWVFAVGEDVANARNQIVEIALRGECSHVLFLDDDVLCHPDLLIRLLSHGRPIVSGLYYTKTEISEPLMHSDEGPYSGVSVGWTHGDLVNVSAHGMGLCLINADLFRELGPGLPKDARGCTRFFATTRNERAADGSIHNTTEDVAFCRLLTAAGYPLAVDTSAAAFGWHFDGQRGYPLSQWAQFMAGEPIEWPSGSRW